MIATEDWEDGELTKAKRWQRSREGQIETIGEGIYTSTRLTWWGPRRVLQSQTVQLWKEQLQDDRKQS